MNEKTPTWPLRISFDETAEEAWYLLSYSIFDGYSSALLVRIAPNFDVTVYYEMQGERRPFVPFEKDTCALIDIALADFQTTLPERKE